MSNTWMESFQSALGLTMSEVLVYLPRILGFLFVLLAGVWLAKLVRKLVKALVKTSKLEKITANTPLEHFLKEAELGSKLEDVLGSIVYWLMMLVVLHTAVSILGLTSLLGLIEKLLFYLPQVISAALVLFLGVLLAGLVEGLIKGSLRSVGASSSRLVAKFASYLVLALTLLISISELGIAREFILILFVGFVAAVSLGLGLAFGLGGQHLVKKLLEDWHKQNR